MAALPVLDDNLRHAENYNMWLSSFESIKGSKKNLMDRSTRTPSRRYVLDHSNLENMSFFCKFCLILYDIFKIEQNSICDI